MRFEEQNIILQNVNREKNDGFGASGLAYTCLAKIGILKTDIVPIQTLGAVGTTMLTLLHKLLLGNIRKMFFRLFSSPEKELSRIKKRVG